MASKNFSNSLKDLYMNILIDNINENNYELLTNTLSSLLADKLTYNESDLFVMINIILLVKRSPMVSPLMKLQVEELEAKIVRMVAENFTPDCETVENHSCDGGCDKCHEAPAANEDNDVFAVQSGIVIKKRYYCDDGGFILPAPGATGNLRLRGEDPATGLEYDGEVEIDSQGYVVSILREIRLIDKTPKAYDEIYAGLMSDILQYQEEQNG